MNQVVLNSTPARDGAGVNINRVAGANLFAVLDPFLMLDEIRSEEGDDYMAGFPDHPHRGFETITYLREGRMRHRDHMGNESVMESGGVQWMTAGRGVVHSEMPEQTDGLFHGFQVWLNLPAADKMIAPDYRDIHAEQVVVETFDDGTARLISGALNLNDINMQAADARSRALVADLHLDAGATVNLNVRDDWKLIAYVYEGDALDLERGQMMVASEGRLELTAAEAGAGVLLLAGKPLNEPVVQYGPFVMTSREEIEQALRDYQGGTLIS